MGASVRGFIRGLWFRIWPFAEVIVSDDHPPTLEESIADAQQLLIYATRRGIEIDNTVSSLIIGAARKPTAVLDGDAAGLLLAAIAGLAAKVAPVTAQSIAACRTIARREIRRYTYVALALAFIIVLLSIASSVTNGISNSITTSITNANELVLQLHTELDTSPTPAPVPGHTALPQASDYDQPEVPGPPGALSQLQQFASTIRELRDETQQLNWFLVVRFPDPTAIAPKPSPSPVAVGAINATVAQKPFSSPTPVATSNPFELSPYLPNLFESLRIESNNKTATYQDVREWAKDVQGTIGLWYGAISTILLPMFYALLGACAYLLRLFSKELASGSFSNAYDISARFFVALIGGIIVGLFGSWTAGVSLSPLALAFLVGYAADVFFAFLENSVSSFNAKAS
jgi:hypothetical protein